ncbi:MAG: glycosyltransferase family 39 protein [Chloroflexota bacterium]
MGKTSQNQTSAQFLTSANMLWLLAVLGTVLRLIQYARKRPLWEDEARLALNIIDRSYAELLTPLSYNQAAPPLFLLLEKAAQQLFGDGELALRLIPLLVSIVALWLFAYLAREFLTPPFTLIALALFATAPRLIYYSSEVKQYGVDVFASVVVLWLGCLVLRAGINGRYIPLQKWLPYLLCGALLVWLSHPSVFGLAAVGLVTTAIFASQKRWHAFGQLTLAHVVWAVSFLLLYSISARDGLTNRYLQEFWQNAFMPAPTNAAAIQWFVFAYRGLFREVLGFVAPYQFTALGLLFAIGVWVAGNDGWKRGGLLLLPILFTLYASALRLYPFSDRLLLFLTPFIILTIAIGLESVVSVLQKYLNPQTARQPYLRSSLLFLIIGLLFLSAGRLVTRTEAYHLHSHFDVQPLLETVHSNWQIGDQLYLEEEVGQLLTYYLRQFEFTETEIVTRDETWQAGERLWVYRTDASEEVLARWPERLTAVSPTQFETYRWPRVAVTLWEVE